jgi:histidine ammonia-lyase/phenylalanine ammonia-lyase
MGTIAARDARSVLDLVFDLAALHLAALAQAADLRDADRLGQGSRRAYEVVRRHVRFCGRDRRLDTEVAALAADLRCGAIGVALAGTAASTAAGAGPRPADRELDRV